MEREEFNALRIKLGIKQLWARVKDKYNENAEDTWHHIVMNGETSMTTTVNPRRIVAYEVRDDDGVTVLATRNGPTVIEDDMQASDETITNWPSEFDSDDDIVDADQEDEYEYRIISSKLHFGQWFINVPDEPFYKILGVPLFYLTEGEYRGVYAAYPMHPLLVCQWRDLVDCDYHKEQSAILEQRIRARTGKQDSNKRPRIGD